jgi:hypothetical protein
MRDPNRSQTGLVLNREFEPVKHLLKVFDAKLERHGPSSPEPRAPSPESRPVPRRQSRDVFVRLGHGWGKSSRRRAVMSLSTWVEPANPPSLARSIELERWSSPYACAHTVRTK